MPPLARRDVRNLPPKGPSLQRCICWGLDLELKYRRGQQECCTTLLSKVVAMRTPSLMLGLYPYWCSFWGRIIPL
ncbi:hypothetical protein FOA52_009601 [Chlamydomonas sp. UWO 241]|nr:hypothetical protein FOA52_009601 [Chlamydomonas sp. UWO 241]